MALDHSRFKTWKTKQALNLRFRFRHVYFTKSCQQIWGCVNQPIYNFYAPHLRWNSTIYYTDLGTNAAFRNFSRQVALSQYSGRQSWTFSENVQKMSKITYTASRFSHLKSAKFAVNINRVTLQHNKQDAVGAYIWAWSYFEHALLQVKNCHHILPEKANPLLHFFAEPHSLYSMSQSTTKIVSFHDNVWKYAYLQCRHASKLQHWK